MYKNVFGTKSQVVFSTAEDYYEFLGYLARNDSSTEIVWEDNQLQGAWGSEGRIHFFVPQPPALQAKLLHTAGVGNIVSRVNCNEFVEHINRYHGFVCSGTQNTRLVRTTVPTNYHADFDRGLSL